jgi:Domain of unknown function (DUF5916)/Carbohydrate family 9 binding domain-like
MVSNSLRRAIAGLALLVCARGAAAQEERPRVTPSEIHAVRLDASSIRLDGVPDEPVWRQGAAVSGLTSYDPVQGQPPVAQLNAWILYDANALYVAARIVLPPGAMRGRLASRERWNNDDLFELMIDPFLDRRTGYAFTINPYGVQLDWTVVDDDWSNAWDGVWDSATSRTANGFSVEMRIPFRTLRFSGAPLQDWGIGLGFFSGLRKQYDKWPPMSQDRGTMFAQLGTLQGLQNIQPSRNLDVTPTMMAGFGGSDRNGAFGWDHPALLRARDPGLVDLGLDTRYGITSATNLNVTINPDFSQVEADTDQLVYNLRYPVLLDEKRPFFLEGVGIFGTPVPLLYTRSIVDPIAGLKLSGHEGRVSFGLFSALDQLPLPSRLTEASRSSGFEDPSGKDALNTVGRVSLDVGTASHVGLFVADKALRDFTTSAVVAHNAVAGADAFFTFAKVYNVVAQVARSSDSQAGDRPFSGLFYSLAARRRDKNLFVEARSDYYSDGFRAETSPITRVNVVPSSATATYRFYTGSPAVPYIEPGMQVSSLNQPGTFDLLDDAFRPSLSVRVGKNTDASLFFSHGQETFVRRFDGIDQAGGQISTYPTNAVSLFASFQKGDQINYEETDPFLGKSTQGSLGTTIRPTRNAEVELKYTKSLLWRPDGRRKDDVDLYYGKVSVSFTTRFSIRLMTQIDTYDSSLRNSALVAYQIYPGTELFAGYQESDAVAGGRRPLDRRLFLKWSYRWRV